MNHLAFAVFYPLVDIMCSILLVSLDNALNGMFLHLRS